MHGYLQRARRKRLALLWPRPKSVYIARTANTWKLFSFHVTAVRAYLYRFHCFDYTNAWSSLEQDKTLQHFLLDRVVKFTSFVSWTGSGYHWVCRTPLPIISYWLIPLPPPLPPPPPPHTHTHTHTHSPLFRDLLWRQEQSTTTVLRNICSEDTFSLGK